MFDKLNSKATALAVGGTALVASSMASAQATFDTADVIADVGVYSAAALAIIAVIVLARWGLHATGLLRPRG